MKSKGITIRKPTLVLTRKKKPTLILTKKKPDIRIQPKGGFKMAKMLRKAISQGNTQPLS